MDISNTISVFFGGIHLATQLLFDGKVSYPCLTCTKLNILLLLNLTILKRLLVLSFIYGKNVKMNRQADIFPSLIYHCFVGLSVFITTQTGRFSPRPCQSNHSIRNTP